MDRERLSSSMRIETLVLALFAITLNFMQPLAHAALQREGVPRALWTSYCDSRSVDTGGKSGQPASNFSGHECCLGLAHVPTLVEPSRVCVALEPIATKIEPLFSIALFTPVSIRDEPSRPRGPPYLV